MYLSKVILPWKTARNPYDIHRWLWRLFPDRPRDGRDFLFRVEKQKRFGDSQILMQSTHRPINSEQRIQIAAMREYAIKFEAGQRLRFRLRANPTKKISDKGGRTNSKGENKKCRVPLIHEDEQKLWLERKFENICSLETLLIHREPPLFFRKEKEQRSGKIQTILFDGILRIKDPEGFTNQLRRGVGPAKAFGCGMISLARA